MGRETACTSGALANHVVDVANGGRQFQNSRSSGFRVPKERLSLMALKAALVCSFRSNMQLFVCGNLDIFQLRAKLNMWVM